MRRTTLPTHKLSDPPERMSESPPDHDEASTADGDALGPLLEQHQARLLRMVRIRLDERLRSRIDPVDVVQEAFLDAARRWSDYQRLAEVPLYVWLRFLTIQKLAELHRRHLRWQARSVAREVPLWPGQLPDASSALLAAQLLGRATTPSRAAIRAEGRRRLQSALESMEPADREIIVLRNFEQLSNLEAARILGLNNSTASMRYLRALQRLKKILSELPEFRDTGLGLR